MRLTDRVKLSIGLGLIIGSLMLAPLLSGCANGGFTSTVTDPETGVTTTYTAEYSSFLKAFDGFDAQVGGARVSAAGSKSDTMAITSLLGTVDTLLKQQMRIAP